VRFAQLALDVAQATVARYRTSFSKHLFTQPQLLAILCLMRYEDWAYREAEVRLAEHSELRRALRLRSVPDYTTLYRFLRRLDEAAITRALNEAAAATRAGATGPCRTHQRLRQPPSSARYRPPRQPHRAGAGRCRVPSCSVLKKSGKWTASFPVPLLKWKETACFNVAKSCSCEDLDWS